MLGDEGYKLVKEAKGVASDHIPEYSEEQVRIVTQETRYLWRRIEEMLSDLSQNEVPQLSEDALESGEMNSQNTKKLMPVTRARTENTESRNAQIALFLLTLNRNKRCLMAYHHRRAEFIRSLLWTLHMSIPLVPQTIINRMSPEEQRYVGDYAKLNSAYRDAIEEHLCPNDSLDWAANGEIPPQDLYIEVRVHRDCGEIVTKNGVVNLQAGTQHYLCRSDIEHLITIGYLEHISSE